MLWELQCNLSYYYILEQCSLANATQYSTSTGCLYHTLVLVAK